MHTKTKIVCTIGPSSESVSVLKKMIQSGMNVARLNFSHGSYENHAILIKNIRAVSRTLKVPLAIMQDLQGSKIRVGDSTIPHEGLYLQKGETVVFGDDGQKVDTSHKYIPVQLKGFARYVRSGNTLFIDDALIRLKIIEVKHGKIFARVEVGGIVLRHKGINAPGLDIDMPVLTAKDRRDVKFGLKMGVEYVALSFVKSAADIRKLRKLIGSGYSPKIVAKIENHFAVDNIAEIIAEADAIMVARGDMGIEMRAAEVPLVQKEIIRKCLKYPKPVIVATQMLDSMIRNPQPTRAEVSDVANAVIDHTDAVMLSGETAFGKYPLESVQAMHSVVMETEKSSYTHLQSHFVEDRAVSVEASVAYAVIEMAQDTQAKVIVLPTHSGFTARMIARHRPQGVRLIALTPHEEVSRQLSLVWGIEPFVLPVWHSMDELIEKSLRFVRSKKLAHTGDKIILVANQIHGKPHNMNFVKIHTF